MIERLGTQQGIFATTFVSRLISIICSFPLEYRYTANLSSESRSESKIIGRGNFATGLGQAASQGMIKTLMLIQIYENLAAQLKTLNFYQQHPYFMHFTSAGVSGLICGGLCYPIELTRILKVGFEPFIGKESFFGVINLLKNSPHVTNVMLK